MSHFQRTSKGDSASSLFRLLSDSALSHAALGACGLPLALLDAGTPARSVSYANPAFEAFFGLRPGEALGRSLGALVLKGDDSVVHRMMAETASRRELRAWCRDGAERRVELSLNAIRGADGRITHWIAAFADHSELERLRAELESLKARALQAAA